MLRMIPIKLILTKKEPERLKLLQQEYATDCNLIAPEVMNSRCLSRLALYKSVYNRLRLVTKLGSQMVCNAIFSVYKAY